VGSSRHAPRRQIYRFIRVRTGLFGTRLVETMTSLPCNDALQAAKPTIDGKCYDLILVTVVLGNRCPARLPEVPSPTLDAPIDVLGEVLA
jgi:hypothetical protein